MIDSKVTKLGYKVIRVGWIPQEWQAVPLRDVIHPIESGTSIPGSDRTLNGDQIGILKVSAVTSGRFRPSESKLVATRHAKRLRTPVTKDTANKVTVRWYGKGVCEKKAALRDGSANTRFYVRRAGQLIYSKLDLVRGAVALVPPEFDFYESTLDLPAFDIGDGVNPRWLIQLLVWPEFCIHCSVFEKGGRKASRISPEDFLKIPIHVLKDTEQDAIAKALDISDFEIDLHRQQLSVLKKQKRGLMQKLLTGELRVTNLIE